MTDRATPKRERGRLGSLPGGCHPAPLQPPYVVYDSRNFSPTEVEQGTATAFPGPLSDSNYWLSSTSFKTDTWYWGPLRNEGTGGSAFDLHTYNRRDYVTGFKYQNWYTGSYSLGTEWPTDWDDLGGDFCNGPFTFMVATNQLSALLANGGQPFIECEELNEVVPQADGMLNEYGIYYTDDAGDPSVFRSLGAQYSYSDYNEFRPDELDAFGQYANLDNALITITVDYSCHEGWLWINDDLVWSTGADSDNSHVLWFYGSRCDEQADILDSLTKQFMSFTSHEADDGSLARDASDYSLLGVGWNGPIWAARFRGSPTAADRKLWQVYADVGDALGLTYRYSGVVAPPTTTTWPVQNATGAGTLTDFFVRVGAADLAAPTGRDLIVDLLVDGIQVASVTLTAGDSQVSTSTFTNPTIASASTPIAARIHAEPSGGALDLNAVVLYET